MDKEFPRNILRDIFINEIIEKTEKDQTLYLQSKLELFGNKIASDKPNKYLYNRSLDLKVQINLQDFISDMFIKWDENILHKEFNEDLIIQEEILDINLKRLFPKKTKSRTGNNISEKGRPNMEKPNKNPVMDKDIKYKKCKKCLKIIRRYKDNDKININSKLRYTINIL